MHQEKDFGWALVVNFHKKVNKDDPVIRDPKYIIDVLLHCDKASIENKDRSNVLPCPPGEKGTMEVWLLLSGFFDYRDHSLSFFLFDAFYLVSFLLVVLLVTFQFEYFIDFLPFGSFLG